MIARLPGAWFLLIIPFASCAVIAHIPQLRALCARHGPITVSIGLGGLSLFVAGMVGALPSWAIFLGGALAGLTVWTPIRGTDDDQGWRHEPPPDDGLPPDDDAAGPVDWERFDRVRAQWELRPRVRR
jgi:hypothetical protein